MAYSDYGAFVYKNGVRMPQLEDADIDERFWKVGLTHGLIEDEHIKVICYKQGLPKIFFDDLQLTYYNDEAIDITDKLVPYKINEEIDRLLDEVLSALITDYLEERIKWYRRFNE